MFQFHSTPIIGCFRIQSKVLEDDRGYFIKSFQKSTFKNSPIGKEVEFIESYFSLSKKNVIRGMHFQAPPADHDKMVHVTRGSVLDVTLDLRRDSPTFGKYFSYVLNEASGDFMFIPKGCAHGFLTRSDDSMVYYHQTSEYAPTLDQGVLWNSFGFDWGIQSPILSTRDQGFQTVELFKKSVTII